MRHGEIQATGSIAVQVGKIRVARTDGPKICQTWAWCNQNKVTRSRCTLHVGVTQASRGITALVQPPGVAQEFTLRSLNIEL